MIIILEPQKDTYVTNLKTQNNDGSLANVGHAATLDLFKLYNENKYAKSWAAFKFDDTNALVNNSEFILQDANGNKVRFFIKTGTISNIDGNGGLQFGATEDSSDISVSSNKLIIGEQYKITDISGTDFTVVGASANVVGLTFIATAIGTSVGTGTVIIEDAVTIGLSGKSKHPATDYSILFKNIINVVSSFNNGLTLNMTAYNNSNNELVLKQNKAGDSGDTTFTLPNNMTHIDSLTKFARIDYSAALIKFDLETFKTNWSIGAVLSDEGAFNNLKAELILKDVTTGIAKPKDYSLELYRLVKSFDEGIGKDTIHFSDKDDSSFTSLDISTNWEVSEYISDLDAVALSPAVELSSNKTSKGDEDLSFDITEYIKAEIVKADITDNGFLIKFPDSILYDQKSYFVKRLGSRHLINKQFVPQLRIKIDDSTYNIPTNSFNKVRYLDNAEDFYLFNRANGNLIDFNEPDARTGWTIKFEIGSIVLDKATTIPTNFSGDSLTGTRKASITAVDMSRYNSTIATHLLTNKTYKDTLKWCYRNIETAVDLVKGRLYKIITPNDTVFTNIGAADSISDTLFVATGSGVGAGTAIEMDLTSVSTNDVSTVVNADNFVKGKLYKIKALNDGENPPGDDTDFKTDFGAADNAANILFIAKQNGADVGAAGTGTAYEIDITNLKVIEHVVLTEPVEFKTAETSNETRYENLITSIRITENDLFANDGTNSVEVYFVDTKKEFNAVKVPYELPSESLGDVYYQLYNVESGNILIDYDTPATKMFYDGEKYKFNLFVPKLFKNLRVNFKFKYKDPITNVDKFIFSDKYSVRIA